MKNAFVGIGIVVLVLSASPAIADSIVVGSTAPAYGLSGSGGIDGYWSIFANSFTLTGPTHISEFRFYTAAYSPGQYFDVQLTDALGAGATILAAASVLAPLVIEVEGWHYGDWAPMPTDVTLAPGTYYLVLSRTDTWTPVTVGISYVGVSTALGIRGLGYIAHGEGTVNTSFKPDSEWSALCCNADVAYEVIGGPAVPEPASLLLLGTGLAGLVRVVRRRVQ